MKSRRSLLPIFFLFFLLALGIFFTSQTPFGQMVTGVFEQGIVPIQRIIFGSVSKAGNPNSPESKLQAENLKLQSELAKQDELKKENIALRDQFKTTTPNPKQLLPAQIIGGDDDDIILDKGESDGIKNGNNLVVNDNVVGKIVKTTPHRSVGELITKSDTSFTVKTSHTSALGIGKGKGQGEVVIDNVVLADKLEKNDLVVTKGDVDQNGNGFPPDLVVGKIVSVNKKTSDLFQSAEIAPLIDFTKMTIVFVMTN